ncbi:hypothetical protein T459_01508 [Capsicum annuum]|uniref:Peptidase S8/S53 domain-containing protein n=1 Tax=Capsicum annuum TaxID=4072 RepID=A0A2G3AH99_CAPAN|nr:hypothetical protein T459_01508 [Capsicum annuum]
MTRVSVQSHRDGKELAPEVMTSNLPAAAEFEFSRNPIAIGAFHAVEKGIFVVASAGNDGPAPESVVNVAPWIFTVGAKTIDRNIETHIPLGRNKLIKGGGISFSNLKKSPVYPLVDSVSVKLDSELYDGPARNPLATILPTAPVMAFFSSRGPTYNTRNLLKPDIAAPGTAILAAWHPDDAEVTRSGQKPPLFNIDLGLKPISLDVLSTPSLDSPFCIHTGSNGLGQYEISSKKFRSHSAFSPALSNAINSDSIVERAIQVCLDDF